MYLHRYSISSRYLQEVSVVTMVLRWKLHKVIDFKEKICNTFVLPVGSLDMDGSLSGSVLPLGQRLRW